jgi:flagellar basal body-associated protein FliL
MKPENQQPDLEQDSDSGDALSMEQINELLAKEDPRFVEELKDLGDLKAPEGMKFEPLGLEMDVLEEKEPKAAPPKKPSRLLRWLKRPLQALLHFNPKKLFRINRVLLLRAWRGSFDLIKTQTKRVSAAMLRVKRWEKSLTPAARNSLWMMFFCLMAMAGAAASLGRFDFRTLMDGGELRDLATVADQVYHFEDSESRESFFSPLRRPEAYILLESMVVQLRPSVRAGMPKLYVEYIVEASSQRAAHEIQQKEGLIRDQIARVTENFTVEELRTVEGKARLKEAVKKEINGGIRSGYVRSVFFKKFLTN